MSLKQCCSFRIWMILQHAVVIEYKLLFVLASCTYDHVCGHCGVRGSHVVKEDAALKWLN